MKRLFFLAAGMFAMGCDNYIFAGLLPGIASALRISAAAAGQGITAFDLAYVISAPVFAVLFARKSARRVLGLALLFFILGNALTWLSSGLVTYVVSRAIVGIGAGLYTPVAVAAATASADPDSQGRALSVVWGANSAGVVFGIPVGLWLADRLGWRAAVILILGVGVIALLGTATPAFDKPVAAPPSLRDRVRLLSDLRVLAVVGVTLVAATGSLGLYTYVSLMQTGAASSLASALWAWSLGGLIGSIAIGYVIDHFGKASWVMAAVLAILIAAILAIPPLRPFPLFGLLPFFLWGAMGWATVAPQQHALMSFSPGQEATLVALNSSAIALGSGLGSALGGLGVAAHFDAGDLPYAAAAILICALGGQLALIKRSAPEVLA